jgi:signal transduction histidine kinase
MRLSEFIRTDAERILREWEDFAKTMRVGAVLPRWVLRAQAATILQFIAEDIERPQLPMERDAKIKGEAAPGPIEHMAAVYVDLRIESGFDLAQIMMEYRALRACVLRLWREVDPDGFARGGEEIARFTEAIDQSVAESVSVYEQREAKYRDRFLGMLGHDLRNPLNSIALCATSLADAPELNEKQLATVGRMLNGVRRLDHMVSDVIDFARGRLGSPMPITSVRANLGRLVREIADEVQSAHPGFLVELEMNDDLNGDWDVERLKQVFSNLLLNAIQHGSGKNIGVTSRSEGDFVSVEVHNEGPPIPQELLGAIFDPLVHGRTSDQNKTGLGLGLGLFIVSEIISAHQGTVAVTSSVDAGTTFSIRLPRHSL